MQGDDDDEDDYRQIPDVSDNPEFLITDDNDDPYFDDESGNKDDSGNETEIYMEDDRE